MFSSLEILSLFYERSKIAIYAGRKSTWPSFAQGYGGLKKQQPILSGTEIDLAFGEVDAEDGDAEMGAGLVDFSVATAA